ncbi:MAG: Mut7-C ubiquitin/RNAse domain-containing protein, partial [Candidatus Bipolaricaulota bacterium]|nr:Mut7-C ubiquitin/RNAse domain-containing protein [Candidatus Bipolaricaulota bacterium]
VEVDLILLGGRSVDFLARVGPGDRVAVYPPFRNLDISPLRRIARGPARPAFVLDGHLGRLARLLRLLGLDALHSNGYGDEELVAVARAEGRVVLTRDRELLKRSAVEHGYWVRASEPVAQAREVLQRFRLEGSLAPFTRCLLCNGSLREASKDEVAGEVPPRVAAWREAYLRCAGCGKVYWEGTHHPRLRELVSRILAT